MSHHIQTKPPADTTADVPQQDAELTAYLVARTVSGVPHMELLTALLANFYALALTHPCCTTAAGKAALRVGGQLIAAVPAHTTNNNTTH